MTDFEENRHCSYFSAYLIIECENENFIFIAFFFNFTDLLDCYLLVRHANPDDCSTLFRLYTFIEWVKEVTSETATDLRTTEVMTFHDRVFVSEMNKLMSAAATAYEKMLFREALRQGFFEMQRSRDK